MSFIRENRLFFLCFAVFAVGGAILLEHLPQGEEIIWLSRHRSPAADVFFKGATLLGEGYIFFAVGFVFLYLRRRDWIWSSVLGLLVMLTAYGAKTWFAHDRPYAWFQKMGQWAAVTPVPGVDMHSGATSFPSGHTMAAFAIYSFLAFTVSPKRGWPLLLFAVALTVGVSRMYLVQHFWKDVYFGALIGVALAWGVYVGSGRARYGCAG
jgi:membrane-associated phospholipid phosphatase